jgi:hypothetical protein
MIVIMVVGILVHLDWVSFGGHESDPGMLRIHHGIEYVRRGLVVRSVRPAVLVLQLISHLQCTVHVVYRIFKLTSRKRERRVL